MSAAQAKSETKPAKSAPPEPDKAPLDEQRADARAALPLFLNRHLQASDNSDRRETAPPAQAKSPKLPLFLNNGWGSGQPLEQSSRQFFERRFDADFSRVRIHTSGAAAKSAHAVSASAVTVGNDIAFAPGRYAPSARPGNSLLAHELAHVVQQSRGATAVQGEGFGPASAEREAEAAAAAIAHGAPLPSLSPVGIVPQRQTDPPKPLAQMDESELTVIFGFRGLLASITIHLDDDEKDEFDSAPELKDELAADLTAIFNPPEGPVPETTRFVMGSRVKNLIEQDMPVWLTLAALPTLSALVAQRAALFRRQQVRAGLEARLGVAPGTIDWNVHVPAIRVQLPDYVNEAVSGDLELDRSFMFLMALENEVAGQPPIEGAAAPPPNLTGLILEYANQHVQYDEEFQKTFAEKFSDNYLRAIAGLTFVPENFDITRYQPSGEDLAESDRENLMDRFIYDQAEGLTQRYLLDKWTLSQVSPEAYLRNMNLDAEREGIITYVTDEFMKQALANPNIAAAIREMATERTQYQLLGNVFNLATRLQAFNRTLPALLDKQQADLDEQQRAILDDPATYYDTCASLSGATFNVLNGVAQGGNVAAMVLNSAQAISGQGGVPQSFGFITFLAELGVQLNNLKQVVQQETATARQHFRGRLELSYDRIADTIRNAGKEADAFIQTIWIPTLLTIAKQRVRASYNDMREQLAHFDVSVKQMVSRYQQASKRLRQISARLETGEQSVLEDGQIFMQEDRKNLQAAAAAMDAKAQKYSTKKGKDEYHEDLEKAIAGFQDVMDGIDSGKYKPNSFGPELFQEARRWLGIGEVESYATIGMVLQRQVVALKNPFQAWAIQWWRYERQMAQSSHELFMFMIMGGITVATFLLPGAAGLFFAALDVGLSVYGSIDALRQSSAVLDLARLDPDLSIQGVSVEDAKRALHDAKIGLVVTIILSGLAVVGIGMHANELLQARRAKQLEKAAQGLEDAARSRASALAREGKLPSGMDEETFVRRITESTTEATKAGGKSAVRQLNTLTEILAGKSPRVARLMAGEAKEVEGLLREYGNWKQLMGSLARTGTPEAQAIGQKVMEFRSSVVQQLERFNARPVSGASTDLISDVDLSTRGVHAGEDMIKAEQYMSKRFGSGWSEMLRMNFYTEAERLTQYEKVLSEMSPAQIAELQRKLSDMSEKYNIAKMLHHAGDNPESIARVEGIAERLGFNIHDPDVQALVHMDESAMLKQRNQLLRQIDGLVAEYETATGPRKVELAQEISMKQVEANFYTTEAYIGPGAGPMTVRGIPVKGEEAFQAAMSDLEMFEHVMGQAAGDPVLAAREYELYKYTNRFVKAARSAGVTHPGMDYFEHVSELLYRVDRDANTTTGHLWKDPKVMEPRPTASVWVTDLPQDVGGFTPVNEQYLRTYVQEFRGFAQEVLPEIRRLARETPATAATP